MGGCVCLLITGTTIAHTKKWPREISFWSREVRLKPLPDKVPAHWLERTGRHIYIFQPCIFISVFMPSNNTAHAGSKGFSQLGMATSDYATKSPHPACAHIAHILERH